jgi:DNA-directed RNA polymerase subunit RPC12/RpoP|tara:strand:- start:381 stop:548 length:168 start_codon:yes stop_codon:yes gene_type:complete
MGDKTSFFLYNGIVNIMPIHEYKCSDCNQIFEVLNSSVTPKKDIANKLLRCKVMK